MNQAQIEKYKDTFPNVCNEEYRKCMCKCKKHSSGCGCLSDTFIAKLPTNFTSILIEAQSQKEYVKCVKALPRHAMDDHSQCDYHPLVVCSCGACKNKEAIDAKVKPTKLGSDWIANFTLCCRRLSATRELIKQRN